MQYSAVQLQCSLVQCSAVPSLDSTSVKAGAAQQGAGRPVSFVSLKTLQCAVCSVVYSVQCAVCSVQCAVCGVQCTVCSVQCAVLGCAARSV